MSQLPFPMPMTDRQAATLDARLMSLPDDFQPRRLTLSAAPTPQPEGRSDISWITTEAPDRQGDVVLAAGMDDAYFRLNPIVTLNHDYSRPPVGRSLWRKLTHDNRQTGVKAKTYYPPRPADWAQGPWLPDLAYGLLQAGLLNAKSIGFLPLKVRAPTTDEIRANPAWRTVRSVVEHWLLLEYACCYLPMQPEAVVDQIDSIPVQLHATNAAQLQASRTFSIDQHNATSRARENMFAEVLAFLNSPRFPQLLNQRLQRTYQKHIGIV
ncbi:MAG: hypothetical protein U0793_14795 [Gemmataceae bacterium]